MTPLVGESWPKTLASTYRQAVLFWRLKRKNHDDTKNTKDNTKGASMRDEILKTAMQCAPDVADEIETFADGFFDAAHGMHVAPEDYLSCIANIRYGNGSKWVKWRKWGCSVDLKANTRQIGQLKQVCKGRTREVTCISLWEHYAAIVRWPPHHRFMLLDENVWMIELGRGRDVRLSRKNGQSIRLAYPIWPWRRASACIDEVAVADFAQQWPDAGEFTLSESARKISRDNIFAIIMAIIWRNPYAALWA